MRYEQLSIGKLIGGQTARLNRFLKAFVATPPQAVANRYFASAAMHNGLYRGQRRASRDGLAHNVTVAETAVDTERYQRQAGNRGQRHSRYTIMEEIVPDAGVTIQGTKAFSMITSITGVGWARVEAGRIRSSSVSATWSASGRSPGRIRCVPGRHGNRAS